MKKTMFLFLITLLPAALAAQRPALAQLDGLAAIKAADAPQAALPSTPAPQGKSALLLLDPSTGKVEVVIPAGGGFIYAASGKFVAAVFNGSGYITSSGQYLPVVGGSRKAAPGRQAARAGLGLSGNWLGWGEWTYQGSGAHCYMDMAFEEGADYLFRKGGYFDCGMVGLAVEPARFVKKGTLLLDEAGQAAGSYENNVIILNEVYSESVDIFTTIKRDGLHFDYTEIWKLKDGSELYDISGRLFTGG